MNDGKNCFKLINDFRTDPTSVPLTDAQRANLIPIGEPNDSIVWSDELFNLAREHSIGMAKALEVSHTGMNSRFNRVE